MSPSKKSTIWIRNYFIFLVLYIFFVILWGAYVRATGSGAGCGSHWPLCNGTVLPLEPSLHTKIEFFHRATSGISLILVLFGTGWIFKRFPQGAFVRKTAGIAAISILLEAVIGAALVLFELVSHDQSLKRTISIALHFINTLVLILALVLTACNVMKSNKSWIWPTNQLKKQSLAFVSVFFFLGMAGAITALGDTLFPSETLTQGIYSDLRMSSHFLVKLRIIHPIIAVSFFLFSTPWIYKTGMKFVKIEERYKYTLLLAFMTSNILVGILNLLLLAPIWLQMVHLFIALSVWTLMVLFLDSLGVKNQE